MRIAAKLLVWFLLVGVVPITAFLMLSNFQFSETIEQEQLAKLGTILDHRVEQIKNYVKEHERDADGLSRNPRAVRNVSRFHQAFHSGGPDSEAYALLKDEFQPLADWFLERFDFYDLFLIDLDGNVVFAARREADFGTNLHSGPFRDSGLAQVFSLALDTGAAHSSSFDFYEPSGEPAAFIATPLVEEGETVGVLALQYDNQEIYQLAKNYMGLGRTGEILIARRDESTVTLVAPLRHDPDAAFARKFPLDNQNLSLPIQKAALGMHGLGRAVDYRGLEVLAAWEYIPLTEWAVAVKIDVAEAFAPVVALRNRLIVLVLIMIGLVALAALAAARTFSSPVRRLTRATEKMSRGDFSVRAPVSGRDELAELGDSFNQMAEWLQSSAEASARVSWLEKGLSRLDDAMRGQSDTKTLCRSAISMICRYLEAPRGALYLLQDPNGDEAPDTLGLYASFAPAKDVNPGREIRLGEGLVGRAAAAREPLLIDDVPEDHFRGSSSPGDGEPRSLYIAPMLNRNRLIGVIEIGSTDPIDSLKRQFLESAIPLLAIALDSAIAGGRLAQSLERSRQLAGELQTQREELKASNEELEEKNRLLQAQKAEVETAREKLEIQARELALANTYKSEFLANMSHELRTPLNSLLLLAQGLTKNRDGNLSEQQLQSSEIIFQSGKELLQMINEILDLSRIETGHMELKLHPVPLERMANALRRSFSVQAAKQDIEYTVRIDEDAPAQIITDRLRFEQVFRNLIGNALKFTASGSVEVIFSPAQRTPDLGRPDSRGEECLAVAVKDSGIGIDRASHDAIFEAFRQVDGSGSRKYGGTGLGLSLARELTRLLGGEIQLESGLGKGSTFTVYLPLRHPEYKAETSLPQATVVLPAGAGPERGAGASSPLAEDDRDALEAEDTVILIVEDDEQCAGLLMRKCREHDFKCLRASSAEEGLELVAGRLPNAVLLDIGLPGMDGWEMLARLKDDSRTRHIPVHVISVSNEDMKSRMLGAVGHTVKPARDDQLDQIILGLGELSSPTTSRVLVVEGDEAAGREIVERFNSANAEVVVAADGDSALESMRKRTFACVVLDPFGLDQDGAELMRAMEKDHPDTPIIVHTARKLTPDEEAYLVAHTTATVLKGPRSLDRLLEEVNHFLHHVVGDLPAEPDDGFDRHDHEALRGKVILVVDDDMRTTFAMSSELRDHGIEPVKAGSGEAALKRLEQREDIDLVLMDVLMPRMNGLEAIREIRSQERWRQLPIIAITGKTTMQDKQDCLDAGASDYLCKPVETHRLLSLLHRWLDR